MKNMLDILARRSFRAGKMRNLIAVLAIMLTAVLFTTVTTIGMGAADFLTLTMQMLKGSRADGDFRNMNAEQYAALEQADFIKEYGLRMPVSFLSNTTRHNVEFDVLDPVQADLTFCMPTHGSVPQAADEVVTSDAALRDLGIEPQVGATVPVRFTAHGREYEMELVLSGWFEATNEQTSMMWAGTAFRDAHPDIFAFTYDKDREMAGTYYADFTATGTAGLQQKLDDWVRRMGGDPADAASGGVSASINTMTNPTPDPTTLALGAVVLALFMLCGYLLIYNVFDIAVMQEIRRYGLYRTIGMNRRQVRRLVNRQALWLTCIGLPLGLIVGFFVGRAALPHTMNILAVSYENLAVRVEPSPVIFAGGAALTALTVFLSTRKPVRIAADTPPMEAFRYVEAPVNRKARRRTARPTTMPRLALANLGRNRRRTAFIVASLALCVVLLNCVGVAAASVDVEKQVAYSIRTDFAVVNAASTNNLKGFTLREQGLSRDVMDAVNAQPGVQDASAIYKNTQDDRNVTYDFPVEYTDTGEGTAFTDEGILFRLGDDGRPLCNVYGMEEVALARMDLQEGETDAHALYEQMAAGKGLLLGVKSEMGTSLLNPVFDLLEIGDIVTVYKDGQPVMELPVLAKAALNGDDEEIGFTSNGPLEVGGDGLFFYLPANVYRELYDEPAVYKYSFNVAEADRPAMTAFLEDYVTQTAPELNYASAEDARQDAMATRTMLQFVGGMIGVIFGVAGVLNLVNTLVTTILTRRHEFATMQSIGMSSRQLRRMMVWEGVFYAVMACAAGLVLSILLGFTVVRLLTGGIWYFTFHFTLWPAAAACAVLLPLSALVPVLALHLFNRGSIVEKLRTLD